MHSFQLSDPLHKRIHDKLKFIGEGPASFFRDVCRIMSDDYELESETHLISHLFREIESAVRDAIRTESEKIKSGDDRHKRDVENILEKLEIPLNHPASKLWLKFADPGFEFQFHKLAHRDSLDAPRSRQIQIEQAWEDFLYVLDVVIDKVQGQYFTAIELIDRILEQDQPSKRNVKILAGNIPHNETTLVYLFEHCNNPKWLPFFKEYGFFDHPSAIIYHEDGSYRYPAWPASAYLQKMAAVKPEKVSAIIRTVPSTENRRVYESLVIAITRMPAAISVTHMDKVLGWIHSGSLSHASDPYFDLSLHLAENGYTEESLNILQAMLRPVGDGSREHRLHPATDLKVNDWEFERFLDNRINAFREPLQLHLLKLMCTLLSDYLQLEFKAPDDASYIWQRSLSLDPDDSTRRRYQSKNQLLHSLLHQIDHFIQQGVDHEEIIECLKEHEWHIFFRIKLLLYNRHEGLEKLKEILLDRNLFDSYWISREYKIALHRYYPRLTAEEQQIILEWIDSGLSISAVIKRLKRRNDNPSEDEISLIKRRWKWRKLSVIADYLEGDRKIKYTKLVEEFGDPAQEVEPFKTTTFIGPTSPKAPEEFSQLSVPEVIDYLKKWKPKDAYNAPSPEGLGRVMHEVIKAQPEAYSKEAMAFQELIPTYVRSLISGLRDAVHEGANIHWEPVLTLSAFVLEQDDEEHVIEDQHLDEPGWQWTRKRIADLLGEGCKEGAYSIPFTYRRQAWELVHTLTDDPQPDQAYEKEYSGGDPLSLSINTVRGEAMHALFYYTRWVRRHLTKEDGDSSISFEQMPEVREVLERHLDLSCDPTLTIRSVYGQHMGTLAETDPEWLDAHLESIFSSSPDQKSYFDAAWEGFISFHRAHVLFLDHLRPVYKRAIVQLNADNEVPDNQSMSERRLVEHLIAYFWWNHIDLDDELFTLFFNHASAELKGYVLDYVGRSLEQTGKHIAPEVLEQSKKYIEHRINKAQEEIQNDSFQTELAYFGWCFTAGCFEDSWTIIQLWEVLGICHRIEHSYAVVQKLPDYVSEYPDIVLDCIKVMVKHTSRTLELQVWRKSLKEILTCLLTEDEPIAGRATELIQHISQRRYHLMQEFKPLLE